MADTDLEVVKTRLEAEKVYRNQAGDSAKIAAYVVERCGDFVYDTDREFFISEFLAAAYRRGIREERERCTRIADSYTDGIASEACASVAHGIAADIRASVVKP